MKSKKAKTARFKIQRRLLTELPGLGKAGALERRPYPPGQHGGKRIKYSDYRLQLEEKQKIKFHYDVKEEQLLRFVKKAKASSASGKWIESLVNLLERRLDNIVFRSGVATSIASAKQLVSHGKILVNGEKVDIRSFIVNIGDEIQVKSDALLNQVVLQAQQSPRLPLPDWLEKISTDQKITVKLKDQPNLESIPFAFEEALVTSYYSKV
ncbi:MAG: 30S ribosomal protein S4 [Pseudobdellovibrio sp.]